VTPKELIVVGGPNGSGKTTFAEEYVSRHRCTYISADAIAAELSIENPVLAQLAAGREVLHLIYNAGSQPQDVAVGTASDMSIRDAELYAQFERLIEHG
jgi:predicted ABC-type ATPase